MNSALIYFDFETGGIELSKPDIQLAKALRKDYVGLGYAG